MATKVTASLRDKVEITLADETNDEIIEGGEERLATRGTNATSIFMERDIADIMETVFNMSMLTGEGEQGFR